MVFSRPEDDVLSVVQDALSKADPYMAGAVDEYYPAGEASTTTSTPTDTAEGREPTSTARFECGFEGCRKAFSRQADLR